MPSPPAPGPPGDGRARARAAEKARKILAMADDPAGTDAERQAFAARAADIMARHDLTEAVVRAATGVRPDPIILWDHPVTGTGGHGKARAYAAGAIAEAYGCEVCYRGNTAARSPRWVRIVGAASDIDALRMLLPVIAAQAEPAALAATRAHLARLRTAGWPTAATPARESAAYRRSYLQAYGAAVARQIRDRRAAFTEELAADGSGAELVLADRRTRASAEFTRLFPTLRAARADRTHSSAGWADGLRDGRAAHLEDRDLDRPDRAALPHPPA
jgi:hypothetical protein